MWDMAEGLLVSSCCQFEFLVCRDSMLTDTGLAERVTGAQITLTWKEGKELMLKAMDMILMWCSNYANHRITLCNILMLQNTGLVGSKFLTFWKNR